MRLPTLNNLFPNPPIKLIYLFEAEYFDGTIYKQNPQDASIKEPPKPDEKGVLQGRNCRFDIQEDLDNNRIKKYSLIGRGVKITVDLTNGEFYLNKNRLYVECDTPLPRVPDRFHLLAGNLVNQHLNVTYLKTTGEVTEATHAGEERFYLIGWECLIDGKKYQQRLALT